MLTLMNLGEMTYLQLATVYGALDHLDLGGIAIGWFASGTGAAGLVGAGLWWTLRGLGVRQGLLICAVSFALSGRNLDS